MTTQLLTGIPGTGKTHHLTQRALRYLADGNDPARLLILAPTRTAATRMRDTIAASSDRSLSVAPTRAWAAYAFDLLKRAQTRGLLSGVEGNLKLLSGPEQDVIIGELLANHAEGIAPGPAWPDVLRDALATRGFRHEIRDFFDRMAEYDLTAEDVHALATEHNQPAWHALAQLHTEYRAVRALRAKNAYDPAVLINDACRLLLRAPEFLAEERRRYDLILIDDVRELSPSIYRLLRLIAAEEPPTDAAHLTETHPDLFAEGLIPGSLPRLRTFSSGHVHGGVQRLLATLAGVDEQTERVEEGAHGGLVAHRHERRGGARRNAVRGEHAADARHVRATAHDDGGLAVGVVAVDAFFEQHLGDEVRLVLRAGERILIHAGGCGAVVCGVEDFAVGAQVQ